MVAAVPEVGRRPVRVTRDGDHLEVAVQLVAAAEGSAHAVGPLHGGAVGLVDEERRIERCRREERLVPVAEVVAGDSPQLLQAGHLLVERGRAVDQHVPLVALQQEGACLDLRCEGKPLGSQRVEAGDPCGRPCFSTARS